MPIVFDHADPDGAYHLALWEYDGRENEPSPGLLNTAEAETFAGFKSQSRRREFIGVRLLLRHLAGPGTAIVYGENGNPFLSDGRKISITHSGERVGVILATDGLVGIDLEATRSNIDRIAQKFISEAERHSFAQQLSSDAMHVIWCAKEILFKMYVKGGIDFRNDLQVQATEISDNGSVLAIIRKQDLNAEIQVHYCMLEGYVLAWGHHRF